jgi:hypothetical protein
MTFQPTVPIVSGQPVLGLGWTRVAKLVSATVEPASIDRIWLFAPVRHDEREWGTALIACRTDDGRQRIFTASYLLVIRGRERGQGKVVVEEVGTSPPRVLHEVIVGVQERADESEPPVEIAPGLWFGADGESVGAGADLT